jgi:predicted RNA binding protein YcfA (HicA-like mRNA interferase family)
LKPLPFREVARRLEQAGFSVVSQKGSHVKFQKITPAGTLIAIVPMRREVPAGIIRSLLKQAGITPEQWEQL